MLRWRLFWKCSDCGSELYLDQSDYSLVHDEPCPKAVQEFGTTAPTPDWLKHIWQQQVLDPHECDNENESLIRVGELKDLLVTTRA